MIVREKKQHGCTLEGRSKESSQLKSMDVMRLPKEVHSKLSVVLAEIGGSNIHYPHHLILQDNVHDILLRMVHEFDAGSMRNHSAVARRQKGWANSPT
jgi:hypothetical protein